GEDPAGHVRAASSSTHRRYRAPAIARISAHPAASPRHRQSRAAPVRSRRSLTSSCRVLHALGHIACPGSILITHLPFVGAVGDGILLTVFGRVVEAAYIDPAARARAQAVLSAFVHFQIVVAHYRGGGIDQAVIH